MVGPELCYERGRNTLKMGCLGFVNLAARLRRAVLTEPR